MERKGDGALSLQRFSGTSRRHPFSTTIGRFICNSTSFEGCWLAAETLSSKPGLCDGTVIILAPVRLEEKAVDLLEIDDASLVADSFQE